MPIKPENKHLYPKEWKLIRELILEACDNKCEFCGAKNHEWICRDEEDPYNFIQRNTLERLNEIMNVYNPLKRTGKVVKVVLTVAHIDQDPTHNTRANLKALCKMCHNRLDAPYRAEHRKKGGAV